VPVYRMKYIALIISGGLAGMGGAFLSLVASNLYREGQTGGRGFIGLAAMIFGNWRPGGLAAGAGLFGYSDALQLRDETGHAVHALLLSVVAVLAVVAVQAFLAGRRRAALVSALVGLAFLLFYLLTATVPTEFVSYTPQIITLLVLSVSAQRLRPPAADGKPYRRGQQEQ
jgi:general nucleoside transport system permease protein